jgi:hypothetical protein
MSVEPPPSESIQKISKPRVGRSAARATMATTQKAEITSKLRRNERFILSNAP